MTETSKAMDSETSPSIESDLKVSDTVNLKKSWRFKG